MLAWGKLKGKNNAESYNVKSTTGWISSEKGDGWVIFPRQEWNTKNSCFKKNSMWKCSVILFFFEDFFKLEKHCMPTKIQTM